MFHAVQCVISENIDIDLTRAAVAIAPDARRRLDSYLSGLKLCLAAAIDRFLTLGGDIGSSVMRRPVASATTFATAGVIGHSAASPTPFAPKG